MQPVFTGTPSKESGKRHRSCPKGLLSNGMLHSSSSTLNLSENSHFSLLHRGVCLPPVWNYTASRDKSVFSKSQVISSL